MLGVCLCCAEDVTLSHAEELSRLDWMATFKQHLETYLCKLAYHISFF